MPVKRLSLRGCLIIGLLISAGFAAWSWFRPYAWNVDPNALCEVVGCQVRQDRTNFWVDAHLQMKPGKVHDLMKPVRLVTAAGREIEPADTTLAGAVGQEPRELWFKFWLESEDMQGPLELRINGGSLVVKAGSGMPNLGASRLEYFVTNRW